VTDPPPYKSTLFDRLGPDAQFVVRAWGYGLTVFGTAFGAMAFRGALSLSGLLVATAAGALVGLTAYYLSDYTGRAVNEVMFSGSSTPYQEQYSYQQALVMQGKVAEALESFEALIVESPESVAARIKAAELYAREGKNPTRAAELFREARRIPAITPRDDVYIANRLVDLFTGPLGTPGRALVELRRLIERYPGTTTAANAREALGRLKGL
jgi:hypothetical protein